MSASNPVFGDTGDHSFPKQNANNNLNPNGLVADKLLSEIAEEDSVSMISDRPRKIRKSEVAMTPTDPAHTQSIIDSLRVSQNNNVLKTDARHQEDPYGKNMSQES